MAGRDLSIQITFALLGRANVVEEEPQDVGLYLPADKKFDRRNAHAFLIDFAAASHRTGVHPADIRMMRARSHVKRRLLRSSAGKKDGHHQRDIGQMSS